MNLIFMVYVLAIFISVIVNVMEFVHARARYRGYVDDRVNGMEQSAALYLMKGKGLMLAISLMMFTVAILSISIMGERIEYPREARPRVAVIRMCNFTMAILYSVYSVQARWQRIRLMEMVAAEERHGEGS